MMTSPSPSPSRQVSDSTVNADLTFQLSFMGIKYFCSLTYCSYGFVTFRTAEEARKVQEMVCPILST